MDEPKIDWPATLKLRAEQMVVAEALARLARQDTRWLPMMELAANESLIVVISDDSA
jgi:hypothetical protein